MPGYLLYGTIARYRYLLMQTTSLTPITFFDINTIKWLPEPGHSMPVL